MDPVPVIPTLNQISVFGLFTMAEKSMKRYYFHGDKIEGTSGEWYCRRCDDFVETNHWFNAWHCKDNFDYKRLKIDKKLGIPNGYNRPTNSENYFS